MISTTDLARWIGSVAAASSIPLYVVMVSSLVLPGQNLSAQHPPPADPAKNAAASPPATPTPGAPAAPAGTQPAATGQPAAGAPAAQPPAAQAPIPRGPTNAVEEAVREGKGDLTKKKAEKPARVVPREEHLEKPGAPRPAIENFRDSKRLAANEPAKGIKDSFEDMRRGRVPNVNANVIDQVAKWKVYQMTGKSEAANLTRYTSEITTDIRQARTGLGAVNTKFLEAYKKAVVKYAKDLLDNSFVVRINAMLLMNDMFDGVGDVSDAIPIYLTVLKDPKQFDAVKVLALIGLERAKEFGRVNVEQEREAAQIILDSLSQADKGGVQPILLEETARALGKLGRAFRGDLPERAEVATVLANLALDSNRPIRLRYEAAVALGNLRVETIRGWNFELQGLIIAKVLRDLVLDRIDGKVPEETSRYWVFRLGKALLSVEDEAKNAAQSVKAAIAQILGVCGPVLTDVMANEKAELRPLDEWIAQHDPPALKNRKLAEQAAEVVFRPKTGEAQAKPNGEPLK